MAVFPVSLSHGAGGALEASAARQAALVRSGAVSARELVSAALAAVDPEINAFASLCAEQALAEADRVRAGDPRPLCGVPIAAKDLISAVSGTPTTHGSAAFGEWRPSHDSAHIRRLREAGAIVIGRTTSPELGLRPVTESQRYGITRNPVNRALMAGGSSGGSAAAVAAGTVALADGSDLGGSIRIPAACCGVVGFKPGRGRVSIGPDLGAVGYGMVADGPIARTVLDAAIALDAMTGYEPGELHWAGAHARAYAEATQGPVGRVRVRLALDAPLGVPVDAEPRVAARQAAALLAELGHDVEERVPDWDDPAFADNWATAGRGTLQHLLRVIERLHGRPCVPELLEPATRAWVVESPPVALIDFLEAIEGLAAFSRRLLRDWPDDLVLVTPTLTRLPAAVGMQSRPGVTEDAVRFSALVRVFNVTGQPAISLPLHQTSDGIPVGVQLVGAPGRDDLVLALAAQLEAVAG